MIEATHRLRFAVLACVAIAATPAVGNDSVAPKERPNVVLITMEATRPDHLGCYDDQHAKTPALDQLAREGAMFDQAIAVAPLMLPSLASIMTGLYPPRHGVRDDAGFKLDPGTATLVEHLKAHGYATHASVGNSLLGGAVGLKRGFDSFAGPTNGSRGARDVVDDAIAAARQTNGVPFFLWVQFDDPHAPYMPPPPYRSQFSGRPYDGELAWMDSELKRLVDNLKGYGLFDNTIVVATAAQGESLGEHGEETHGLLVYDATLKVPLIMRYPGKIQPANRVLGLVSLIDVAPTLIELIGLPPMTEAQGRSFVPALRGDKIADRGPVYAESLFGERAFRWAPLRALRTRTQKFIDAPAPEVYDARRDPSETIDLAKVDPVAATALRAQLKELRRTIGDMGGAESSSASSRRNPKTLVAVSNLFMNARAKIENGHPEQAAPLLERAIARDPTNPAVTALLAALRAQPVEPGSATPNTFASQWNLGNALYVKGELDESARAFRAALALNPQSAETHYVLGNVLAAQGNSNGAERELRAAVAADPKMADGWNKLGIILDRSKRRPEALEAFSHALNASPDHPDALFNRAKLELLLSDLPAARRDVDRLEKTNPGYSAGLFLDAHLCVAEKNQAGARAALTKLLAQPNGDPRLKAVAQDMLKKLGN